MRGRPLSVSGELQVSRWLFGLRLMLLVLPVGLMVALTLRLHGNAALLLWLGTLFQALACVLTLVSRRRLWEPLGPVLIMLYVIALSWVLLGTLGIHDWLVHLAQAVLLVVPLGLFAVQCLNDSGAISLRRARYLAHRLAHRPDWPTDLQACRLLPEVKALREALHLDATPALQMLAHFSPAVRIAGLAALEFRPKWEPGQADLVLRLAKQAAEPEIRAAAVNALANLDDRELIEQLAELLYDTSGLVRKTAGEALLWNMDRHWSWIRPAVRRALAEPLCQSDGPLCSEGILLTPEAITDLSSWCAEKGMLSLRAAATLAAHYHQVFSTCSDSQLSASLLGQVLDPHTPAMLRMELARLLQQHGQLPEMAQLQMLDPSNPTPLRLLAVDSLLGRGPSQEAQAALREMARVPNREIALTIADLLQRRLGIPLGLTPGEPLPSLHSRQAAEIARGVYLWASQADPSFPAHGHSSAVLTAVDM